jgi:hypothetical protein
MQEEEQSEPVSTYSLFEFCVDKATVKNRKKIRISPRIIIVLPSVPITSGPYQ